MLKLWWAAEATVMILLLLKFLNKRLSTEPKVVSFAFDGLIALVRGEGKDGGLTLMREVFSFCLRSLTVWLGDNISTAANCNTLTVLLSKALGTSRPEQGPLVVDSAGQTVTGQVQQAEAGGHNQVNFLKCREWHNAGWHPLSIYVISKSYKANNLEFSVLFLRTRSVLSHVSFGYHLYMHLFE